MQKSLLLNNDYMKWLETYIIENGDVATTYNSNDKNENARIKNLIFLYVLINAYAKNKGYAPIQDDYGNHYFVQYNDNVYDIGCEREYKDSIYAFCSYENVTTAIINWDDIKNYFTSFPNKLPMFDEKALYDSVVGTKSSLSRVLRTRRS